MEKHLNCLSKGHRNTEGIAAQVRRLAVSAEKDGGAGPGRKRASSRVSKHSMGQAMDWGWSAGVRGLMGFHLSSRPWALRLRRM